jgi:thioesterase domain-containing protein
LVREAWTATAPLPFDAGQCWGDTGADSLATLTLLLRLEKSLGRKLSFDLIHADITATGLAQSLSAELQASTGEQERPASVFLVPGVFGDEPRLADFRRACDGIDFEMSSLPEPTEPAAMLRDIPATGRFVARAIVARYPAGEIVLAGYSFGGSVAFEAARSLIAAGRRVVLLVVLDTLLWQENIAAPNTGSMPQRWSLMSRLRAAAANGRLFRAWRYLRWRHRREILLRLSEFDLPRRLLWAAAKAVRPDTIPGFRRLILTRFRGDAIDQWRPAPLPVTALFAASNECTAEMLDKWRTLLPAMEVVHIDAAHLEIFTPQSLKTLVPAFEDAVAKSVFGHRRIDTGSARVARCTGTSSAIAPHVIGSSPAVPSASGSSGSTP